MFAVRAAVLSLLVLTLRLSEAGACECRRTRNSTEVYVVPRDKHELYLVIIPTLDSTAVIITITSPDGKVKKPKKPMLQNARQEYKLPFKDLKDEDMFTVRCNKEAELFFCFSSHESPTAGSCTAKPGTSQGTATYTEMMSRSGAVTVRQGIAVVTMVLMVLLSSLVQHILFP